MTLFQLASLFCPVVGASLVVMMISIENAWVKVMLWIAVAVVSYIIAVQLLFVTAISFKLKEIYKRCKLPDPLLSVGIFASCFIPILSAIPVGIFSNVFLFSFYRKVVVILLLWVSLILVLQFLIVIYVVAIRKAARMAADILADDSRRSNSAQ